MRSNLQPIDNLEAKRADSFLTQRAKTQARDFAASLAGERQFLTSHLNKQPRGKSYLPLSV